MALGSLLYSFLIQETGIVMPPALSYLIRMLATSVTLLWTLVDLLSSWSTSHLTSQLLKRNRQGLAAVAVAAAIPEVRP
jgi:hypothetical protein